MIIIARYFRGRASAQGSSCYLAIPCLSGFFWVYDMTNNTFYFPHDYNAQRDGKIISLLSELGAEGYGIFWLVIELLAQNHGRLQKNYKSIAFVLHVDIELLIKVIQDYNLFVFDDDFFYSERLLTHFEKRKSISKKRSEAVQKRWNNQAIDTNVIQMYNKSNTKLYKGKERKGKEKKGKEIEEKINKKEIEEIYFSYPRKVGKGVAIKAIEKALKKVDFNFLLERTKEFAKSDSGQNGKFTPHPATWYNQERYNDDPAEWNREETITDNSKWCTNGKINETIPF